MSSPGGGEGAVGSGGWERRAFGLTKTLRCRLLTSSLYPALGCSETHRNVLNSSLHPNPRRNLFLPSETLQYRVYTPIQPQTSSFPYSPPATLPLLFFLFSFPSLPIFSSLPPYLPQFLSPFISLNSSSLPIPQPITLNSSTLSLPSPP